MTKDRAAKHDEMGYPFPPPHSVFWENDEGYKGMSYDEAVSQFHAQSPEKQAMNVNPLRSPLQKQQEAKRQEQRARIEQLRQERETQYSKLSNSSSSSTSAGQSAYDFTEQEWNKNLKEDLKKYLEERHVQTCILTVDDAARCALNLWKQKNEEGETVGTETLKLLEDIHSKVDIGVGLVAAAKVSKALGSLGVTVKQYVDTKGKERIIISSLWNDGKMHYAVVNGLNIKKNHPYLISNPTIKQLGTLAQDTVKGFRQGAVITLIVSAAINTNELVFNDDYHLVDWFGNVGSDLFKAMAVLVSSTYLLSLTVALGITMPILAGVLLWVGVDWVIGELWESFKVEDQIVNGLKSATNG